MNQPKQLSTPDAMDEIRLPAKLENLQELMAFIADCAEACNPIK
jgi:hypothetical protein